MASRASDMQTKGSYVVKVHGRTTLSRTEFPNANPRITPPRPDDAPYSSDEEARKQRILAKKCPITPHDKSRLFGLRQDPSVRSLVDMYDAHGRLDEKAFSNTPRRQNSRRSAHMRDSQTPQRPRRQSTLRDLLQSESDKSDSPQADFEGDISWADRFLKCVFVFLSFLDVSENCYSEANHSTSSLVTTSSLGLETPTAPLFKSNVPFHEHPDMTFDSSMAYPYISSMEVEVSVVMDPADVTLSQSPDHGRAQFIRTPSQRASQVFGFLAEKRQQKKCDKEQESNDRPLPTLPTGLPKQSTDSNSLWVDDVEDSHMDFTPILDVFPAAPLSNRQLQALALPPAPLSPAVLQPLQPPPTRTKSISMGAAEMLKPSRKTEKKAITMSTAPLVVAQAAYAPGQLRGPRGPRPRLSTDFDRAVQDQNGIRFGHGETANGPALDKGKGKETSVQSFIPIAKGKSTPVRFGDEGDHYTPVPLRIASRKAPQKSVGFDMRKQAMITDKENMKAMPAVKSHTTGKPFMTALSNQHN